MFSKILTVALMCAGALAQDSAVSSVPYTNENTKYLTQTNSLGVVTGQPAVVTSQPDLVTSQPQNPAVVTTQPPAASIPAGLSDGLHTLNYGNSTFVVSVNTEASISSVVTPTPSPTETSGENGGDEESGSPSGASGTGAEPTSSQGAAAGFKAAGGALVGAGALFAALL
ncbi:hypothetical protein EJ05DRAFT_472994 [Pseudovirgaria hyperparasitica]|uniref:GPI anchored protein n=1 Tax=Pseudovirgaria hyperparasitica TaxID=470096 RepID=A0A6A6WGS6_9PEZI|nr:uncharacterized protein EJ05DRAFT_472994 [Pseudovirgaria hyperparasitica]KAF2762062.1 hypothetical protein EJ05DRAFT_472994 [Pseudovirgaria hyperparasitica]